MNSFSDFPLGFYLKNVRKKTRSAQECCSRDDALYWFVASYQLFFLVQNALMTFLKSTTDRWVRSVILIITYQTIRFCLQG